MYKQTIFLAVLLIALHINSQTPDQDQVEIIIPGYPHKFYSGYLPINSLTNKNIHYVFFESQSSDISKDPLVLWLSGGPGCSSLLGAFHQNGPFIFIPGKHNISLNKNAWNKNANLLYLQLPAGVGFSQVQDDQQIASDQITIQQAITSLRLFLAQYPKLKRNDLYLTGHAYASVYITKLAKQMIDQNNDPFSIFYDKWNLKGIMVGNPCTKPDQCYSSGSYKSSKYHYQFLYKRGFFSKTDYDKFLMQCTFNYNDNACYKQRQKLNNLFNSTNTSQYNIYSKCYRGQNDSLEYINTGCEDQAGLLTYLNDRDVQQHWNIRFRQWKPCNNKIFQQYLSGNNSYHLYPFLIKNHLRIWIYSGDVDSKIPIIGTKKWISQLREQLQMPIKKNWREWWVPGKHKGQDQVGGFIWELEGLTFVSVKGAGLMTAYDKPIAMQEVLYGFLNGKTLPYKAQ